MRILSTVVDRRVTITSGDTAARATQTVVDKRGNADVERTRRAGTTEAP
jgi:hypothetical protein